jgi:catechol 2,3-dioxygenase-like lactoylglutathione lyase family enzyme
MVSIRVREIVIDHPRDQTKHLLEFYAALTGFKAYLNEVHPSLLENGNGVDLGLQPVDDYQPPSWPTQERGQQLHIDFATPDLEEAATFAESIGATRPGHQPADDDPDEDFIVMMDPVGHPFCFVRHHEPFDGPIVTRNDGRPAVKLRMPFIDCPDHRALADFYARLLDGAPAWEPDDEYSAIRTADGFPIGFQRADGYQPPTWPTQQRGQQLHMDLAADDLAAAKAHAIACGATVAVEPSGQASHIVMLDPAGHPFCLGQDADAG